MKWSPSRLAVDGLAYPDLWQSPQPAWMTFDGFNGNVRHLKPGNQRRWPANLLHAVSSCLSVEIGRNGVHDMKVVSLTKKSIQESLQRKTPFAASCILCDSGFIHQWLFESPVLDPLFFMGRLVDLSMDFETSSPIRWAICFYHDQRHEAYQALR